MSSSFRSYPENAAIAGLGTAELFAVIALRLWAESYLDDGDGCRWRAGFVAAGLGGHAATFDAIFLIVATAARRPLDVRCKACLALGGDEALFLRLIGFLQRPCLTGAKLALTEWLAPSAARTVLPFALMFAGAMAELGLKIPRRPSESRDDARKLSAELERLGPALGSAERSRDEALRRIDRIDSDLAELRAAASEKDATIATLREEGELMEQLVRSGLAPLGCETTEIVAEKACAVDLGGRQVAYIGGLTHLVGFYRALVERFGGSFLHHDGGLEHHKGRLERILCQADAVMCPVDRVSHAACLTAKQFCKRRQCVFIPLRSAGLSSFVAALRALTAAESRERPFADGSRA